MWLVKQRGGNDCKEKEEEKIQEYAITPAKKQENTLSDSGQEKY